MKYLVRVAHPEGFLNMTPATLPEAREQAKEENKKWVTLWHKHASGQRPIVEIWALFETIDERVKGVDKF